MGHKHEIEVYVMVDEVESLPIEEQCAFFKEKLQKYACMMDIVQGEYEKAYLEVRRTRGLPVYSDTMFKEEIPKAAAPAETMAVAEPAVEEPVMESVPEMVMPEVPEMVMPEPEPEPEPFVPETIEEHANAVLESIEAMDIPMEAPVEAPVAMEMPIETPVVEMPVEVPVAEIPVEVPVMEAAPAVDIPIEIPVAEAAPAPEVALAPEVNAAAPEAPVIPEAPVVPEASAAPVEMSPDEIAAMLAAAQATA